MSRLQCVPRRPLFAFPERLTESTVRLVAGGVTLSIVVGAVLQWSWILPLLALGFALRVAAGPHFSPLARLAIVVTAALRLPERTIPGAPKQFAASLGAVALTLATGLWLAGLPTAAWGVAGVVAVLAGLEAAFAFCLGCVVYAALLGCEECGAPGSDLPAGSSRLLGVSPPSVGHRS